MMASWSYQNERIQTFGYFIFRKLIFFKNCRYHYHPRCSKTSLRKQLTFRDATNGFPEKWRQRNEYRNERRYSILMMRHYPDLGSASDMVVPCAKFASTNQKHYPDLGSDVSSVWNISAHFSDVIWRGNQWWRRQMSAVFSGYAKTIWNLKQNTWKHSVVNNSILTWTYIYGLHPHCKTGKK